MQVPYRFSGKAELLSINSHLIRELTIINEVSTEINMGTIMEVELIMDNIRLDMEGMVPIMVTKASLMSSHRLTKVFCKTDQFRLI